MHRQGLDQTEQDLRSAGQRALRNVGGMEIKMSHSFITVNDQEKALTFYRDALGMAVTADAPLGPFRWLTVSAPNQPGVEIVLATPDMGHGPDDTEALKMLLAKGALNGVLFTAADWTRCSSTCARAAPRCCRSRSTSPTGSGTARSATPPATTSASGARSSRRPDSGWLGERPWPPDGLKAA